MLLNNNQKLFKKLHIAVFSLQEEFNRAYDSGMYSSERLQKELDNIERMQAKMGNLELPIMDRLLLDGTRAQNATK